MSSAERAAFAAHPQLRRLAELRDRGGWSFIHTDAERGGTVGSHGIHAWPDGTIDVLFILGPTEAQAVRVNPTYELVWLRDGDLASVLDALLELPPPDDPRAPRLIIARTPPPLR